MGRKCLGSPVADRAAVLALYASLLIFGEYSVNTVLENQHFTSLVRDLDAVELWSGVGTVVAACAQHGLHALPFDKDRVRGESETEEDITSRTGFE